MRSGWSVIPCGVSKAITSPSIANDPNGNWTYFAGDGMGLKTACDHAEPVVVEKAFRRFGQ